MQLCEKNISFKLFHRSFIILLIILFLTPAYAQESIETLLSLSLEELLELPVVSTTKSEKSVRDAPSIVSVMSREQIERYGWFSINDILHSQPGFTPSHDYDRHTLNSRGLFEGWNNNHLLLLIDGVPFNDNLYGTAYTWEVTPLFLAKSIEIIRGPGSALYGSNATNGVITINTLNSEDLENSSMVRVRVGDNNQRIYDLVTGHSGENFNVVLGYNSYETNGNTYASYDDYHNRLDPVYPLMTNIRDSRSSQYFFSKLEGKKALDGFDLQYHFQKWDFQTGHGWLWLIPDFTELMREERQILSLKYSPESESNLDKEYVVRYQSHNIAWNMRYAPDGANENFYPNGVWEYLDTNTEDIFARIQYSYELPHQDMILAGIESDIFLYDGDKEHYSNIDMSDSLFAPNPDNSMTSQGAWLGWGEDHPVLNLGTYFQYTTGNIFGPDIEGVIGIRYDSQRLEYNDADFVDRPVKDKSFDQISPRFGLVYQATEDLILKAMSGRAFRAPSPSEMFGTNTWALASNLKNLEPEIVTTSEIAIDYNIIKNLNWRLNAYYMKIENQIAYSEANRNLSTNIYDLTNAGLESEWMFSLNNLNGFLNLSYVKRIDETIIDATIIEHDDLTWTPSLSGSLGLNYSKSDFSCALIGSYHGEVKRRDSDKIFSDYNNLRPDKIDPWLSLDMNMEYNFNNYVKFGVTINNLLDSEYFLIKNTAKPFDYLMPSRRVMATLQLSI
jgi:outer membrane receptor protein involved in Fe transport